MNVRKILFALAICVFASACSHKVSDVELMRGPQGDMDRITPEAITRIEAKLKKVEVDLPLKDAKLVFIKNKKILEFYAQNRWGFWKKVEQYPVLAASGTVGPKIKEGDKQVPEGIYSIEELNTESDYHLAFRVTYPNAQDKKAAALEKRKNLGSEIMIHGSDFSIGCVAIGNSGIEELFYLALKSKSESWRNWTVIFSPFDFRDGPFKKELAPIVRKYPWMKSRYKEIAAQLVNL